MKRLVVMFVILLIAGNTLTLIGLTTNVSESTSKWLLYGGPVLTGVAVIGVTSLYVYLRRRKRNKAD